MYFSNIIKSDIANGPGIRITIFVSGCTIHCKKCFNKEAWNFNYGNLYTKKIEDYIIGELNAPQYSGLTILGGEPFEFENQPEVLDIILRVRKELPDKNIWIFSGNIYDINLIPGGSRYNGNYTDKILDNIDVLVDGPFKEELYDHNLKFKGSSNQRIIDMKETRKQGKVILHELNN